MNDKKGPTVAWVCAVLVALLSLIVAASAARTVHAASPRLDGRHAANKRYAQDAPQTPPIDAPAQPRSSEGTSDLTPGDHTQAVTVNGQKRTFLIHVPRGYKPGSKKPLPVVVMLHGAGGSGKQAETQTGWDKKADKVTFLAVFPDALPPHPNQPAGPVNPRFWHDGSHRGEASAAAPTDVDDVAFIGAVLDTVGKQFPIDEKRVFVTGHSSGASMTFRILVSPSLAARFAAGAPVSGHLWVKNAPADPNARRVPALLIWGTADPINPIAGGRGTGPLAKPSLQTDVNAYAAYIGAPDKPAPISDEKGIKRVAYGPGENGAEFIVVTVEGAGHVWPGSPRTAGSDGGKSPVSEKVVGPSTNKLNATDAIWTFFQRHYLASRSVAP